MSKQEFIEMNIKDKSISFIAQIIDEDWKKINYGAVPYLEAMHSLETVDSSYGYDTGKSVVTYFLANAQTWRGEMAKAVKAELNRRIKA